MIRTFGFSMVALILASCATPGLSRGDVSRFETKIRLPVGAYPLDAYARFYSPPRIHTLDELPFTTILDPPPGWPEPRGEPVVAAVFVRAEGPFGPYPSKAHIVHEAQLPYAVHGGCEVINLIIDPVTGVALESWCNVGYYLP